MPDPDALLACAPPAGDAHAPIVGGAPAPGEPAVVVVSGIRYGECTGTLISPSVVLTAKHCVQLPGEDGPLDASALSVGIGDRLGPTLGEHPVRYVETTPGSFLSDPLRGAFYGVDVAVLVLTDPITDIEPIPIRRDRPDDVIGHTFTAVGFGDRPDGGTGERYETTGTLDSIADDILYANTVTCVGDSGGPMIQEGPVRRVIGVSSFVGGPECPSTISGYNAIYDQLDLIDRALTMAGDCLDRAEACNGLDDDCDGEIDDGCAPLGAPCSADTDCAFAQLPAFLPPRDDAARCEDVGGASVCTRPCDPTQPIASCATIAHYDGGSTSVEGVYCHRTSGCDGRCVAGEPGASADGEACEADTDCRSLACADPANSGRRCLTPCRGGAGSCPLDEARAALAEGCGSCVDAAILTTPHQLGEPCADDESCADGLECAQDPAGAYCTHACDSDDACAAGYRCEDGRCARGARAELGEPCSSAEDCAEGSFCVDAHGRQWCSRFCSDAAPCPDALTCETASESSVCAPVASVLGEPCASDGDCESGVCESGVCTRDCGTDGSCPVGFVCRRDDDGAARCLAPAQPGGCSVAASAPSSGVLFAIALAAIAWRRRYGRHTDR